MTYADELKLVDAGFEVHETLGHNGVGSRITGLVQTFKETGVIPDHNKIGAARILDNIDFTFASIATCQFEKLERHKESMIGNEISDAAKVLTNANDTLSQTFKTCEGILEESQSMDSMRQVVALALEAVEKYDMDCQHPALTPASR